MTNWFEKKDDDHTQQNTEAWLAWRRQGIGASDLPIIMEKVDWKTRLQLYEEKIGVADHSSANVATNRGHELEPYALKGYNNLKSVRAVPKIAQHPVDDWCRASLDGFIERENGIVEIKCPGMETHSIAALQKKVPDYYLPQLYWQMYVTNADWCDYVSYFVEKGEPNEQGNIAIVRLEPDQDKINEVYAAGLEFWNRIKNQNPPELSDRDVVEIKTKDALETARAYAEEMRTIDKHKSVADFLKARLIELGKIHPRTLIGNVKVTRVISKGLVNYKKMIPKNVDIEEFRAPEKISYRVTVTK